MTLIRAEKLKKELKPRHMFTMAFGGTIGVGWITMLGLWIAQAGSIGAFIAFLAGGIIILMIGLCYAEVSGAFPASGGEVVYAFETFGTGASYAIGWMAILLFTAVMAFLAVSAGWIVSVLMPAFSGPVLYSAFGADVTLGDVVTAQGGLAALAYLNYRGARAAARFQDIATYGFALVTILFISAGLLMGNAEHLDPAFTDYSGSGPLHGILVVFIATPLWYAGFNIVPQAIGERAPDVPLKQVATAMLAAIMAVTLFYALLILATSMTMPRAELLQVDLPAAGAFEAAFNSKLMSRLVLVGGLLGLVTSWNVVFFAGARVLFALSRARLVSPYFAAVHPRFGTPYRALLAVGIASAATAFLGVGAIARMANVGGMCFSLLFLTVSLAVIRLRHSMPHISRPFRIYKGKLVASVAALASVGMLLVSIWETRSRDGAPVSVEWLFLFGWAIIGLIAWFPLKKIRNSISDADRKHLILGEDPD